MKPLTRKQLKRLNMMLWTYPIIVAAIAWLLFWVWNLLQCVVIYPL